MPAEITKKLLSESDGFSVSLKGEQTFPPKIFRIQSVDVGDPDKEVEIEIKTDEQQIS